jgi:transaldolase
MYYILRHYTTPIIISIFAGRISDTGRNPFELAQFAAKLYPNAEVLWAGCKETLSIKHAIDAGCKIITIPDSIMDRLSRMNKDLTEFSRETVASFKNDGEKLTI